jgi:thioredoxin-like negative regulator of GroEL
VSDRSLQTLLARIRNDGDFVNRLKSDPTDALAEFDLTVVELFALTCGDDDALRRLVGVSEEYQTFEDRGYYRDAIMPAFDANRAADIQADAAAGGKTSKVTSQTVTVCCWP